MLKVIDKKCNSCGVKSFRIYPSLKALFKKIQQSSSSEEGSITGILIYFSWFLTDWLQTSGIYTLYIKTHAATQVRSNMHHRWWEERLKEGWGGGYSERPESYESRQEAGTWQEWRAMIRRERGWCSYPRRSLKSMQPKENQSALLSYAVPFWRTSGAM